MKSQLCLLISLGIFLMSSLASAVKIQTIKGDRTLLVLEGAITEKGNQFIVSDEAGKRRAVISVTQIKDDKAIARIIKGALTAAPTTYSLVPYTPKNKVANATDAKGKKTKAPKMSSRAYGGLVSMAQTTMSVNLSATSGGTANLKGSSFGFDGFYEQVLDGNIEVLGRAGYTSLAAKGSSSSGAQYNVNINYLGLDGVIRFAYRQPKYKLWAGAGLGFMLALSKSSNVIDVSKTSTNQKLLVVLGVDWNLNPRTFIPVQFDYVILPNKSVVTTSQMILRAGYGLRF